MKTQTIHDSLLKQGYAQLVYSPILQQAVTNAVSAWKHFCDQPVEHKESIPFEDNGGYENKDQTKNSALTDHKEDFHITRYYQLPDAFKQTAEDAHFMFAGSQLFDAIRPVLIEAAEVLSEITKVDFVDLATSIEDGWVIRFLHYYPQNNEILAHHHTDKGGHTFHLHDSVPGFERYWNGVWQSMSFPHNSLVFFPGMLGQYYSLCALKALAHRVVSSPQSKKNGRYSIVLFNDYASAPMVYDKKTYGPTQKLFDPGANYNLPFDEFEKYFTKRISQDAR